MKNQILLKSFLLFLLIFLGSSLAFASEVTGTLSSNGLTNVQSTGGGGGGGSIIISNGGGTISGTVNGKISSASIGGGSGTVRSVRIMPAPTTQTNSTSNSLFSADGTAFGPASNSIAQGGRTDATQNVTTPALTPAETSNQTANALGAFSNFSFTSWLWIILLILLLIVTMAYIYSRPQRKERMLRT